MKLKRNLKRDHLWVLSYLNSRRKYTTLKWNEGMNEGQQSFWSMKDRMRLSKVQRQIHQGKVVKDRKNAPSTRIVMGKAQEEMAQKSPMFIYCLLYSHTPNSVFCFVLAHCCHVQIFNIFLSRNASSPSPAPRTTLAHGGFLQYLSSGMHYTPHSAMAHSPLHRQ